MIPAPSTPPPGCVSAASASESPPSWDVQAGTGRLTAGRRRSGPPTWPVPVTPSSPDGPRAGAPSCWLTGPRGHRLVMTRPVSVAPRWVSTVQTMTGQSPAVVVWRRCARTALPPDPTATSPLTRYVPTTTSTPPPETCPTTLPGRESLRDAMPLPRGRCRRPLAFLLRRRRPPFERRSPVSNVDRGHRPWIRPRAAR
jgi:hypothetical protein